MNERPRQGKLEATQQRYIEALRQSEQNARELLNTPSDDMLLLLDTGGVILDANETAYRRRFHVHRAELIGACVWDLFAPDVSERRKATFTQAVQSGQTIRVTDERQGVWSDNTIRPILNAQGQVERIAVLARNVTEQVRAEQALKERSAQLQAANKELDTFAYSIARDLRAPLRAISSFAEIIASEHCANLDEQGQFYFDKIVQASQDMNRLIDGLLDYARLSSRATRRQPVALDDLLAQVSASLAERVAQTGASLRLPPPNGLVINSNQTLLRHIFTHLLDNALIYHRPGAPPQVTVDYQVERERLVARVSDNGVGIQPQYQEKIFDLFQRLHSPHDKYPGAGMGLAIVKKSVELLGGQVYVDSTVDKGSTFSVQLPID
jgi:PAS domain S-box-containing protein